VKAGSWGREFLEDLPAGDVLRDLVPLAAIAAVTLGASAWLFRRRLE
jgi:ABC-2 type transport system permease protein